MGLNPEKGKTVKSSVIKPNKNPSQAFLSVLCSLFTLPFPRSPPDQADTGTLGNIILIPVILIPIR
jgi:hypothetical protein